MNGPKTVFYHSLGSHLLNFRVVKTNWAVHNTFYIRDTPTQRSTTRCLWTNSCEQSIFYSIWFGIHWLMCWLTRPQTVLDESVHVTPKLVLIKNQSRNGGGVCSQRRRRFRLPRQTTTRRSNDQLTTMPDKNLLRKVVTLQDSKTRSSTVYAFTYPTILVNSRFSTNGGAFKYLSQEVGNL